MFADVFDAVVAVAAVLLVVVALVVVIVGGDGDGVKLLPELPRPVLILYLRP